MADFAPTPVWRTDHHSTKGWRAAVDQPSHGRFERLSNPSWPFNNGASTAEATPDETSPPPVPDTVAATTRTVLEELDTAMVHKGWPLSERRAHRKHLVRLAALYPDTPLLEYEPGQIDTLATALDTYLSPQQADAHKRSLRELYLLTNRSLPTAVAKLPESQAPARGPDDTPPIFLKPDIKTLIAGCRTIRDQALIATFYETGARLTEFANLTLGDLTFRDTTSDPPPLTIAVGDEPRAITVRDARPYLALWLDRHPDYRAPAPLWPTTGTSGTPDALSTHAIRDTLARAADRAGLPTAPSPRSLRASRAVMLALEAASAETDRAPESGLATVRDTLGWAPHSPTPEQYIARADRYTTRATPLRELPPRNDPYHDGHVPGEFPDSTKRCPQCRHPLRTPDQVCPHCEHNYVKYVLENLRRYPPPES